MKVVKQSLSAAALAAALLKNGEVVICPTDTVYGFLADASNKKAVGKIYKIKKRPKSKPLPVFVSDMKMARELAEIDAKQAKTLRKCWPGKYTFILKLKVEGSKFKVLGVEKETIALRIPNHPFLQKLLKKINRPLVQTSVNISTQEPLNNMGQIMSAFGNNKLVGLIIDGGSVKNPSRRSGQVAKPSKIIDLNARKLTILR